MSVEEKLNQAKGSIKEGSIVSDKLLEKIQLDGTAPYPNGALMSHFVTLQLTMILQMLGKIDQQL